MTQTYHLAQINIARMRAPIDDPIMARFVEQLDPINALADESPGFVWRLQTEEGNATDIRVFEDEYLLVNMSVWESVEALRDYVYRSAHRFLIRDRKAWFERMQEAHQVLWWVPADHLPTPMEGKARLEMLRERGATAEAFTFKKSFPPPA